MLLAEPQYSAEQVLHAFHHDAAYLFLGSAFITVGAVSVAYCFLRKRFEPLLVWMAAFAALYGVRLWLQSNLMGIELARSVVLARIATAIDFLIPIPGFTFLQIAGFTGRDGKIKTNRLTRFFLILVAGALIFGPSRALYTANNILVSILLWVLFARTIGKRTLNKELAAVRIGVLTFVVLALFDNTLGAVWGVYRLEPYGFAIMLGSFGYVAAQRILDREIALGEIQKELDLARSIQQSILPVNFPASKSFSVAACFRPMNSVAGDLYDFLLANDREAGLLIADVSGHGVPAALIASMVKMVADSKKPRASQPAVLLTEMNQALQGNTRGEMVTAAYVYLDAENHEMRYSAAGHPAMLMLRDGTVSEIAENGLPLAAAPIDSYRERSQAIKAGDRFLLYTDGLVEARNNAGEMFGEGRLTAAFASTRNEKADDAAAAVLSAVERWSVQQDDDRTVLVCDYLGARVA